MNYTLSFVALAFFCQIQAQNSPIDFESAGFGSGWTWTVFENDNNPVLEIITNPDQSGANTSATVAKFSARVNGQPFAGCETQHGSGIGSFTLDSATSTVKIMVWKSVISDVGIKLVEASSASLGEIKVANTLTNQWEELEFDFSAMEGVEYDQLVIFPDFDLGGRAADNICYFDNVVFGIGNVTPPVEPVSSAPDPIHDSVNVISIYSDAYTDVSVDTFIAPWSEASMSRIEIASNPTILYQSLNFIGIEATGANLIDIDSMDSLHLNIWSPSITEFRIKLVDFGADGEFEGGDDTEHALTFTNPAEEEWIDYNIPLVDFTNLAAKNNIAQVIMSAEPANLVSLYVDNIYFSKKAEDTVPGDTASLGMKGKVDTRNGVNFYPNPAHEMVNINSEQVVTCVMIYDLQGALVKSLTPQETSFGVRVADLPAGSYLLNIQTELTEISARFIRN